MPGASAAVLVDGEVVAEGAAGVLNVQTGVEATTDSVFQIGSISKVYTATLVMQLVDDGLVELDAPISRYLPDLRLAEAGVVDVVTVRQLLAHTSGIDGDNFTDTGRGDDCVARYEESCEDLQMTHRPGETMSYCNTGFVLLGRIVERLRDEVWDVALKERLLGPLGVRDTSTLPEEAILRRAAVGHVHDPGAEPVVTPQWLLPRSMGPAGLINATARDLLTFALLHLDGGVTRDGTRVLSEASVRAMQEPQVEMPDPYTLGDRWGLGWILFTWDGHQVFGHDGGTIGQAAFLRVLPERRAAVALLTNANVAATMAHRFIGDAFEQIAGFRNPDLLRAADPAPAVDPSVVVGTYHRLGMTVEVVEAGPSALRASVTFEGALRELMGEDGPELALAPVDQLTWVATGEKVPAPTPVVFYDVEDGKARFLHNGVRACRRV